MTLVKFNPTRSLFNLSNELDRWFNNFDHTDRRYLGEKGTILPLVNVEETNDEYLISAELPGVNKADLKITFEDNVITISAEKKNEMKENKQNYHYMERSYGKFCRSIPVTSSVKVDEIEALYKDGVLKINVPKAEEAKPKEIVVKVK